MLKGTLSTRSIRLGSLLRRMFCFWLLGACTGPTQGTTSTATDTIDEEGLSVFFSVTCDEDGLDVTIYRGREHSWWMGMAVTDAREDVWTGEDCFLGDTTDSGDEVLYCHPINDVNTTLTFGAAPLTLTPGEQTALPDYNICPSLTFYFFETTTEGCWTAGHTPDYYEGLCDNQVSLQ